AGNRCVTEETALAGRLTRPARPARLSPLGGESGTRRLRARRNGVMKAVVFDRFGDPAEVLSVRDVPTPTPGPGQVRVRMLASPVNPSDLLVVRGEYGRLPKLPATPGFEGVGRVEASGGGLL